ncbi:hypothetical protein [Streptomyces sp. NPDC002346]
MSDRIPLDDLTSDQLDALYDERDATLERLDFLDRSTMPDMRRRTASDAATIKRWRDRAEQAEATVERVKNLRTIAPANTKGPTWAALDLAIRDALDQPQQPTA